MAYPRRRLSRRRDAGAQSAAPRPLGCLWPLFWLILIVVLLGLLFGGYRKGAKIGAPASSATYSHARLGAAAAGWDQRASLSAVEPSS